ncbi:HepT-like ribonuclease domain-containing protein [Gordonia sp. LSe1-13]|uniref:HepT-like ribonuclease domain-containing protein n=1 Tax=Gordonia sesuvii TaxID=3116777 RepID=A0ABU7M7N4_9ACTN|nr:HepT-like ribonuclease domain-containing protein [Gordonia sp. LSe1-13]
MSTRPDKIAAAYLWDALNAARNVRLIVADEPVGGYVGNLLVESATERQIEIVGEALRNLRRIDESLAERVPHVHKIIGMRNIFVHGYAAVDSTTVWTAATRDVPALIPVLEDLLDGFEPEG